MNCTREKFLDFPVAEYKDRLSRCRELMREQKLDAVVVTQRENVNYFTGFRTGLFKSKYWTKGMGAIFSMDQDPVILAPAIDRGAARATSWVDDIRIWSPTLELGAKHSKGEDLLTATIKDMGLEKSTIGFELGEAFRLSMPHDQFERIKKTLSNASFRDCSDLISKIRMIKSESEVQRIREACRATDKAIAAVWDALEEDWRRGMTQVDLERIALETFSKEGTKEPHINVRTGPPYLDMANAENVPIRLKRGDLVRLDIGAAHRGYFSDFMRMAYLGGDPPEEWRRMYDTTLRCLLTGIDMMEPGADGGKLWSAVKDVAIKAGYEEFFCGGGHGIGLEVHELPRLHETVLELGMVTTIEPGVYPARPKEGAPGVPGFWLEDNVVITRRGHEVLSGFDRELYVIQ